MRYFKKILLFLVIFNINSIIVFATPIIPDINPEWIRYNKSSDNIKNNYNAIPEKYVTEYKNNKSLLEKNVEFKYDKLSNNDTYPTYFNLTNYNEKNYVNSTSKDQGGLGLCWVFASLGSMESNMLIKGISNSNDYISKCTNDNPSSKYCEVKNDIEQNNNYSNKLVDSNISFSERNIDYKLSNPYNSIIEKYNPYYKINYDRSLGSGGYFSMLGDMSINGVSPTKFIGEWQYYNESISKKYLNSIFNNNTNYIISEYYQYPRLTSPSLLNSWVNELKGLIKTNGAAFVTTIAPQKSSSGSCYYSKYPGIDVIHYTGNTTCGFSNVTEFHAMQIIGWDDNFEYAYCKKGTTGDDSYNSTTCSDDGGSWVSGTGAWILKNSWGDSNTYPYLTYASVDSQISGVKKVSINNFDNVYSIYNSNYTTTKSHENIGGKSYYSLIYKFQKNNNNEYVKQINYKTLYQNLPYYIYISNDGINYTEVASGTTDYSGAFSFDINNYLINKNNFYVKILEGISNDYYDGESVSIFTNNDCNEGDNCRDTVKIKTSLDSNSYNLDVKSFKLDVKTKNINSGQTIINKIYNSNNVDITSNFTIANSYVINNSYKTTMSAINSLPIDNYKLVSSYGDVSDTYNFIVYKYLTINYNKDYINSDLIVNTGYKYDDLESGSYIKLDYYINNDKFTKQFANDLKIANSDITISDNGSLDLKLYSCTSSNNCSLLEEKNITISNIDKVKPTFNYNLTDNRNIIFSFSDDKKLNVSNQYKFAVSNSNTINPTIFNDFENNVTYNINISSSNKYLWIKNFSDEAGNSLCDNEYCIYELEIEELEEIYYKVKYYDEDGTTLLKEESYLSGTNFTTSYVYNKNDDHYYSYTFKSWKNYTEGMLINNDVNLIAIFDKINKVIETDVYDINNNYITNIYSNSITEKYLVSTFKSNIYSLDSNKFYNNNNIINPEYLYTGLKYGIDTKKFIIILAGDVTGDGNIKMNDIMKMSSHIVNGNILSNEYLLAGDVTKDGKVKMNDVMKISSKIVNGGSLK